MQIQAGTNPTTTLQELGTNREGKGKSSSSFPENYVVIDIETTGYRQGTTKSSNCVR